MLTIINPNKLTKSPFFQQLINYLSQNDDVTLRQIKQAFPQVSAIDRQIESFVQAKYIIRSNKRYLLNLSAQDNLSHIQLDQMLIIDDSSDDYQKLNAMTFETALTNKTNDITLIEQTDFARRNLSLSNYFYHLSRADELSKEQTALYNLLGDVNQEYALKYMTGFLAKFLRKEVLLQKRPDIFCQALLMLGYIKEVEPTRYHLNMILDKDNLIFYANQKS